MFAILLKKILTRVARKPNVVRSPYQQGYEAYGSLTVSHKNPYPPGSYHAQKWSEGYSTAFEEHAW